MSSLQRIGLISLACIFAHGFGDNFHGHAVAARRDISSHAPKSQIVHGTIVVVVSTKDGFVLAGDSRGSYNCVAAPGEYQKVFSIGKRAACVVAGIIQSEDSAHELRDAIATHLDPMAAIPPPGQGSYDAADIASIVVQSVKSEAMLLDPRMLTEARAAVSAVSLNDHGELEWITVRLVPALRVNFDGTTSVSVKVDRFEEPDDSRVIAIGSVESTVKGLVGIDAPRADYPYSDSSILRKYYELKKANHLSELSLADGEALARQLVEAAIAQAQPCDGVGGSIDVLTLSAQGVKWVQKKTAVVTPPPPYVVRVFDSDLNGKLDGLECLRCVVEPGSTLRFEGRAEARIVEPIVKGTCKLVFVDPAEHSMPATVALLRTRLDPYCDVYRESSTGVSTRESRATERSSTSQFSRATADYASMCNTDLKAAAQDLANKADTFRRQDRTEEDRRSLGMENLIRQTGLSREQRRVLSLKYDLLESDFSEEALSTYREKFGFPLIPIRNEIFRRLGLPVPDQPTDSGILTNDMNIDQAFVDLLSQATKLPADHCSP